MLASDGWNSTILPPPGLGPLCLSVGVPGTLPSKTPQGEWGAVSQAAAALILAHMCAITVGAQWLHGSEGECHSEGESPSAIAYKSVWACMLKQGSDCLPQMVVLAGLLSSWPSLLKRGRRGVYYGDHYSISRMNLSSVRCIGRYSPWGWTCRNGKNVEKCSLTLTEIKIFGKPHSQVHVLQIKMVPRGELKGLKVIKV